MTTKTRMAPVECHRFRPFQESMGHETRCAFSFVRSLFVILSLS